MYYEDSFYVTAGTENEIDYSFYLVISSEDIKDAKAVRLDITDLDDLTSDDDTYTTSISLIVKGSGNDNGSNDNGSNDGEESITGVGSTSSGCDVGISLFGLGLALMMLMRKK